MPGSWSRNPPLALISRAARHGAVHRHFHGVRAAESGRSRTDEGSQDRGRDEQGQHQTMRNEPKLHEPASPWLRNPRKALRFKTPSTPEEKPLAESKSLRL